MAWQVVKPLRAHPLSVGQARNFALRRLESVLADRPATQEAVGDAATIASELVTNAVTAGSTTIELSLSLRPHTVLIEVADDAAGEVVARSAAPTDPSGRGLMIVAALSSTWGVSGGPGSKRVWAEVDLAPRNDSSADPATHASGTSSC